MYSVCSSFDRLKPTDNLHAKVTRALALRVIEGDRASTPVIFPNEAGLCEQLGVSRSILREAVKVLVDKGMLEVKPRSGTRSRTRTEWNLLDPDILAWQSELEPDPRFLRDLCEVRLAIEPIAAGFAALRATTEEIEEIRMCLERREAHLGSSEIEQAVDLDLQFQAAVIAACRSAPRSATRHAFRQRPRWRWRAAARFSKASSTATLWPPALRRKKQSAWQ